MKLLQKTIPILILSTFHSAFANETPAVCQSLFALVNRPSVTGSPCTVPVKKVLLEAGYQYLNVGANVHGYSVPQAEIRFGLPGDNEFLFAPPVYYHQTTAPSAGWSAALVSLKHEIAYSDNWITAIEADITLPSGSQIYGSGEVSEAINGFAAYNFNSVLGVTAALGVASQSQRNLNHGNRFTSINGDVFFSWQLSEKILTNLELYGQTRTGYPQGGGLLTIVSMYYLVNPRVTVDAEIGQRINGGWGFQNYLGAGVAVLFN